MNHDFTQINEMTKQMNPHCNFDGFYEFYYDETNNIKKLHIKKGDFNVDLDSNFILGGFVYNGARPDLAELFSGVILQPNINEVKLRYIATGSFTDCLKSSKLTSILQFLFDSDLYLHYSSLNLLYFSIVDIVDSVMDFQETSHLPFPQDRFLKNVLYIICRSEINAVRNLFLNYDYPNIAPENMVDFVNKLLIILHPYKRNSELRAGIEMLETLLKRDAEKQNLTFITDERSLVLIHELSQFYIRPLYTFINANHNFDGEAEIETMVHSFPCSVRGKMLKNFVFLDSKADPLIQASDIIIGLIGKLTRFVNTNSRRDITDQISAFNTLQLTNLDLILKLIMKSEKYNPGFFHHVDSVEELSKYNLIHTLRGTNI